MSKTHPILSTTLALLFLMCGTIAIHGRVKQAAAEADDPVVISIKNKKFDSAKITIKIGQTVKWVNDDEHDHTVAANDGSFKSENIGTGDEFTFTFKTAGKYSYSCTYHPRMKGIVVVEE